LTRALTPEEQQQLQERTEAFADVMEELEPAICELADHLGMPHPERAIHRLDAVLAELDQTLPKLNLEALEPQQLVWLNTRLLYFIGQWLVKRYEGHWLLQDDPESDFFLHYVTGGFQRSPDPQLIVDPLELAIYVLGNQEGRLLSEVLAEVFAQLPPE
jgi:hypothetical protein